MNKTPAASSLTLRSGGWVVLVSTVLALGALAWGLRSILSRSASHAVGDGKNVASYGFDLSRCLVSGIVASGLPKDGLHALVRPAVVPAPDVETVGMRKLLVSSDRVVGVEVDGHARAYPIRILNWHEVVNDTLGGQPIAVTYSPLCDSVVVFDRQVEGETIELGFSGLLHNSNLLMYDRRGDPRRESLWSQLQCRAVAGPLAASVLPVLHASLVRWADWRRRHPTTTVINGDPTMEQEYRRDPYASYYGSDRLRFPVSPAPPVGGLPNKAPVVVVKIEGERRLYTLADIAHRVDRNGLWRTSLGSAGLLFEYRGDPPTVAVTSESHSSNLEVIYSFWFAWYATHDGAATSDEATPVDVPASGL